MTSSDQHSKEEIGRSLRSFGPIEKMGRGGRERMWVGIRLRGMKYIISSNYEEGKERINNKTSSTRWREIGDADRP